VRRLSVNGRRSHRTRSRSARPGPARWRTGPDAGGERSERRQRRRGLVPSVSSWATMWTKRRRRRAGKWHSVAPPAVSRNAS
jgi:hypothetical protein